MSVTNIERFGGGVITIEAEDVGAGEYGINLQMEHDFLRDAAIALDPAEAREVAARLVEGAQEAERLIEEGRRVTNPNMTPALVAIIAKYRDEMEDIVPDDQRQNDAVLAAMLLSDLRQAYPGVVEDSKTYDP